MELTLSIVKPDAVKKNVVGKIISCFEENDLRVVAIKRLELSKKKAGDFYAAHKERPFFNDLVGFMSSGPVVAIVLSGKNAILKNRELMGATNPKEAKPDTIRAKFANSIEENAVHGSDSKESAAIEIPFFFSKCEILV